MYRKYLVYLDDGNSVYRIAIPAKNEKQARHFAEGNGEIIAVRDITEDCPISAERIAKALDKDGFTALERDFIVRALTQIELVE